MFPALKNLKWRRRHAGFYILYFIAKLFVASWGLIFPCFKPIRSLDCHSSWRARYCCIYEWVFLLLGFDHDYMEWPSALISICIHHHELESLLCVLSYKLACVLFDHSAWTNISARKIQQFQFNNPIGLSLYLLGQLLV